jgi:putative membrane protein
MLAGRSYRFTEFLFWTRRTIYALVVVATLPVFFYEVLGIRWLVMPWGVVLLLGTAVALMAGFKSTQTYGRYWAAQQAWLAISARSRAWGTMCRDLVRDPEESKKLIYRHFAWLTALRYAMRQRKPWETADEANNAEYRRLYTVPEKEASLEDELMMYVPCEEVAQILVASNKAARVLSLQGMAIRDALERGVIESSAFARLHSAIGDLHGQQCGSELIKGFPYPRQYAIVNMIFVRILCVLLPLGLIEELEKLNDIVNGFMAGNMVWLAIPLSVLVSWMYTSLDQVGESTANPFEGGSNDVPITRLCREIEIDLKEMLGEINLPRLDGGKHVVL